MVAVERPTVELFCDEHVVGKGVLDQRDRPVAVEATEGDMGDRRARLNRRLDDHAIEGLERDSLPLQVGGGPAGNAVKVGGELSARKRRERGQRHGEGLGHSAADLDHRIDRDSGGGPVEVFPEAREAVGLVLAGGKRHVAAPTPDAELVCQSRSIERISAG